MPINESRCFMEDVMGYLVGQFKRMKLTPQMCPWLSLFRLGGFLISEVCWRGADVRLRRTRQAEPGGCNAETSSASSGSSS